MCLHQCRTGRSHSSETCCFWQRSPDSVPECRSASSESRCTSYGRSVRWDHSDTHTNTPQRRCSCFGIKDAIILALHNYIYHAPIAKNHFLFCFDADLVTITRTALLQDVQKGLNLLNVNLLTEQCSTVLSCTQLGTNEYQSSTSRVFNNWNMSAFTINPLKRIFQSLAQVSVWTMLTVLHIIPWR